MRLLIDESVKGHIAKALGEHFALGRVAFLAPGVPDEDVVALAADRSDILVTEDRGMAWTAMNAPQRPRALIVIELESLSRDEQADRVLEAMQELDLSVDRLLAIIGPHAIRRRFLEISL